MTALSDKCPVHCPDLSGYRTDTLLPYRGSVRCPVLRGQRRAPVAKVERKRRDDAVNRLALGARSEAEANKNEYHDLSRLYTASYGN